MPYVYRLAWTGKIQSVKLGKRRLVPAEVVDALLAELKSA